ncbi:antA/AntB antirepressor family protein [Gilliamella apicola]|uniref:antA/AntB antirepressor family protein n=1 Tax=Gilliamella sp. Bif1-4 TaxID=3120233 RepID=UPI0009BF58FE
MTDFNNLVPVTETQLNGKLQQTVSAKQLHRFLGVGRDFSNWIKGRIEQYGFTLNDDFFIFDSPILVNQSDPRQNIRQCPPLSFFRFGNIVVHIVQVIPSHWLNDGVSDYNRFQYIQIVLY